MFAYSGGDLPSLCNYGDALRYWSNAKTWRGETREWDKRKLDGNKRHITIRKGNNNQIICRMHATDVVVFCADGQIDVDCSYGSRSTDEFIWSLLRGSGIHCRTNEREPVAWVNGEYGYHFKGSTASFEMDAQGKWRVLETEPIYTYASKPAVAKQVRAQYGMEDFKAWRQMVIAINGEPDHGHKSRHNATYRPNTMRPSEVVERLRAGVEEWKPLAENCSLDYVQKWVDRNHPEIVAVAERGPFTSERDYQNWKSLDRKYGWAVKGY